MKKNKSLHKIGLKPGVVDTQTKLKLLDTTTKVKVNGVEVSISEYMSDPKKYNSIKMSDEYVKQITIECEEAKKLKEVLKCNPVLASGYKDVE